MTGPARAASVAKIEQQLIDLWSDVLTLDKKEINVTDSFFELGGDSLQATALANKISKTLGIVVPLKAIFQYEDIGSLSYFLTTQDNSTYLPIPIKPTSRRKYYPLSSAQQRMYFLYKLDQQSLAYNVPQIIKLTGIIDKERLCVAFEKLIVRHESLRTCFGEEAEPVQKIVEDPVFDVIYQKANENQVDVVVHSFIRPFNLKQAPLLRVLLITLVEKREEHILVMDFHHIVTDGVSQSILTKELMTLYHDNDVDLPKVRLQYKDYAVWQQSMHQQKALAKQKRFWHHVFAEVPEVLKVPTDFTRPLVRSHVGSSVALRLDEEKMVGLKKLGEEEGATLSTVLLAAYAILLSKLSGQEDLIVGMPVAGRNHADLENIVGLFVNTLPIRNYPKGNLSFRTFLEKVQANILAGLDHQDYPYEELVSTLAVERDTSRNPLFDVMFSYQNFGSLPPSIPDLILKSYNTRHTIAKFDLTLIVSEAEGELLIEIEYATELFKRKTIRRWVEYFKRIITAIIEDSEIKLSSIGLLSEVERHQLIEEFNGKSVRYPQDETIVSLFQKQAESAPEAIALLHNGVKISYGDLNVRANRLAHYLQNQGVEPGGVVGLMIGRSVEMIVGILGILKAGGTYLPLEKTQPPVRIFYMLSESQATVLLTDYPQEQIYSKLVKTVVMQEGALNHMGAQNIALSSSAAACIIYTSGSTGQPKGVRVTHRSIINLLYSQREIFGIEKNDRILQFSSVIFDASIEQIGLALLGGASLVLISQEILTDSFKFKMYIADHKVTHLDVTPSFLDTLEPTFHKGLKRIVVGGEAANPRTLRSWRKHCQVYNAYGLTESTVTSTVYLVPTNAANLSNMPIGRPIQNTLVYILDKYLKLLPVGVPGELHISGHGLTKGYINNEVLTQERFVENPFRPGEKMYRTGDLARWLPDGNIEYIGRIDQQVKIRGFRIELNEIAYQLATHEWINEAIVLARGEEDDQYLVAYYVSEQEVETAALKNYLSGRLPNYMIPDHYVFLSRLPLTVSGKVDRKALPVPEMSSLEDYLAPTNEIEAQIVTLWSKILKLDREEISVTKSFFELGGHSLRATVLMNKIFQTFAVEISLVDIFTSPTVKALSRSIQRAQNSVLVGQHDITVLKRNSGTDQQLFFIHDGSGGVQSYVTLAKLISGYHCLGIPSNLLHCYGPEPTEVSSIALRYLEKVKAVQPTGPYYLIGWSSGGAIAYEVARQLEATNHQIGALILIDTALPSPKELVTTREEFALASERAILRDVLTDQWSELENHETVEEFWKKALIILTAQKQGVENLKKVIPSSIQRLIPHYETIELEELVSYFNAIRSLQYAVEGYQPEGKVEARSLYIKAEQTETDLRFLAKHFSNITCKKIPTDHFMLLHPPHVPIVAKAIADVLKNSNLLEQT